MLLDGQHMLLGGQQVLLGEQHKLLSQQHKNLFEGKRKYLVIYFLFLPTYSYLCNHEEYSNALDGHAVRPAADGLRQAGR